MTERKHFEGANKTNLRVLFLTFGMVNFMHVLGTVVREVSIQGEGDGTAVVNQV